MNLTLDLPRELIKDVQFEADHEEVSVEEWVREIIRQDVWRRAAQGLERDRHPDIADQIWENMKDTPPEEWAKIPEDGALEHDHYIYGTPKRYSNE